MTQLAFEDHAAISALIHRYCTILDRMELDCLDEVFTEDCRVTYGEEEPYIVQGRSRLRSSLRRMWRFRATSHHTSNINVRAIDEGSAEVESYVIAWQRPTEGEDTVIYGRYIDKFVLTAAGWRIRERVMSIQGASSNYRNPLHQSPRNPPEPGWEGSLKGWS